MCDGEVQLEGRQKRINHIFCKIYQVLEPIEHKNLGVHNPCLRPQTSNHGGGSSSRQLLQWETGSPPQLHLGHQNKDPRNLVPQPCPMAICGCPPTKNWNRIWQSQAKINLKFPLLLGFRPERPVRRLTASWSQTRAFYKDNQRKVIRFFCGIRINILLWDFIIKKRENTRIFPLCIFTKMQEYTEKEKLEIYLYLIILDLMNYMLVFPTRWWILNTQELLS